MKRAKWKISLYYTNIPEEAKAEMDERTKVDMFYWFAISWKFPFAAIEFRHMWE